VRGAVIFVWGLYCALLARLRATRNILFKFKTHTRDKHRLCTTGKDVLYPYQAKVKVP